MKITLDVFSEYDSRYIVINLNELVLNGRDKVSLQNRMLLRNPVQKNEKLFFEIRGDTLGFTVEYLESTFKNFDIDVLYSADLNNEIKSYLVEKENFQKFSFQAKKIRNNEFEDSKELIDALNDFNATIKTNFKRQLYPRQALSAFHMAFSVNSMNFSVPGAGKTSIVLAAYEYLKTKDIVDKLIIVGPISSFQSWEEQYYECFEKEIKSFRHSGGSLVQSKSQEEKSAELYSDSPNEMQIFHYQGIANNLEGIKHFLLSHKCMIVVDEAHRIKNSFGLWGSSITDMSYLGKSRIILTGTPIPNGYEDIYNQIKFIYPEKYKSIIGFHYNQLVEFKNSLDNESQIAQLKENLEPYFLRIRKKDLPKLPEISESIIPLEMKDEQSDIYDVIADLSNEIYKKLTTDYEKNFFYKALRIRLQQASTNPHSISKSLENLAFEDSLNITNSNDKKVIKEIDEKLFSGTFRDRLASYYEVEIGIKFEYTRDRIKELTNSYPTQKVIVWTIFKENAKFLKKYLNENSINSDYIIGDVEVPKREALIKEFRIQESELTVLIANPFTIGESVSLHQACNYAIYLERDYNCSNFVQSKDRIHRVGSKFETVFYEYLINKGTIDELIHNSLRKKIIRMDEIIEDDIPFFGILEDGNEDADLIKEILSR